MILVMRSRKLDIKQIKMTDKHTKKRRLNKINRTFLGISDSNVKHDIPGNSASGLKCG